MHVPLTLNMWLDNQHGRKAYRLLISQLVLAQSVTATGYDAVRRFDTLTPHVLESTNQISGLGLLAKRKYRKKMKHKA